MNPICEGTSSQALNQTKVDWLKTHWWSGGPIEKADLPQFCSEASVRSLEPGNLVEDSIIDEYCKLLKTRELMLYIDSDTVASYYFMNPWFFQVMATYHSKKKNPLRGKASEWDKFDGDCKAYGTLDKGARNITNYTYILMPVSTEGHWLLFLWSVKDYRVTLFDSLRDDAPLMSLREVYAKEYYVVVNL